METQQLIAKTIYGTWNARKSIKEFLSNPKLRISSKPVQILKGQYCAYTHILDGMLAELSGSEKLGLLNLYHQDKEFCERIKGEMKCSVAK